MNRQMTEEEQKQFAAAIKQLQEQQQKIRQARLNAAKSQAEIDKVSGRREMCVIAAVDQLRGFAKGGKIPWSYSEDFQWFKKTTDGQICVMGRNTYQDINERLGEKAKDSVLPGRTCFVVSNTLESLPNATVIKHLYEIEHHLPNDDERPVFVIGGERLFREAIAVATKVYLTVINKDYDCDKYFPVEYMQEHYKLSQTFKAKTTNELRFLVWTREK